MMGERCTHYFVPAVAPDRGGPTVYHFLVGRTFEGMRMPLQFTVLASGSGGNASLLDADGFGVLLDVGLGPRQLAARLASVGASWKNVHAVLLTHTHGDHWTEATLNHLLKHNIPLYCHPEHHAVLQTYCLAFPKLCAAGQVRDYAVDED